MHTTNEIIHKQLHSNITLINQINEYIINNSNKHLHPTLVLLSTNAFDYDSHHHHELTTIVEFIHTTTLLHDNVVDESSLRRGRATANAMFGNAASVLSGDFLYSRAFQIMTNVNSMHIVTVLSDTTNVSTDGKVLQLLNYLRKEDSTPIAYGTVPEPSTSTLPRQRGNATAGKQKKLTDMIAESLQSESQICTPPTSPRSQTSSTQSPTPPVDQLLPVLGTPPPPLS